jgi:cation diffusion facilitator CzcD-associated flavoprotein CzcO
VKGFWNWSAIENRLKRLVGGGASDDEVRRMAEEGERLEMAARSGGWELIWNEVLVPMREDAQAKLVKVDPTDFSSVAQYQKVIDVINEIPKVIEKKVMLGRNATKILSQQYTPTLEEGE